MNPALNITHRLALSQTNRPIDILLYWEREGSLCLDAPYQRGDVWGLLRRRNLIKSIFLGIPIPSIVINDRAGADWDLMVSCAVIDGKQRITTILKFLKGQFSVPGVWFGMDQEMVFFKDISVPMQRRFRSCPVPFTEGRLPSLEAERELFELINFGGVPQGACDPPDESELYPPGEVDPPGE